MPYNDVSAYIGEIGRFQWRILAIVFFISVIITDAVQMVFIGGFMNHWCLVEELVNLPDDVQKNVAIPVDTKKTADGGGELVHSSCQMFALNYSAYDESDFLNWNRSVDLLENTVVVDCKRWTYDQSRFLSTIVSKFNLVCGWNFLVPLVSTVFMSGMLIGSSICGLISDRYGRKTAMIIFSVVKVVGSLTSIFADNYVTFLVGRFLLGISGISIYLPGFIVVIELTGKAYRAWLSCVLQAAFAVGFMLQPLIAYCLRDEFYFQIAIMSPSVLLPFVIIFWFPESPRWLFTHRKRDRLLRLLEYIRNVNGKSAGELPVDFDFLSPNDETDNKNVQNGTCLVLCSSSVIRLRAIVIYFSWFTCSLIYYALTLNTGSLHGNIYINTFVSATLEIPGYVIGTALMNVKLFGRRLTGCLSLIGAGLASFLCIPLILTGYPTVATAFSMLGKAFICISYAAVYLFASELFPTEIRNIGLGTGSTLARISAMSASFIGGPLTNVWKPLPSMLFGACSTISGLSYLLLPETLGQQLADTVLQAERQNSRQGLKLLRIGACCRDDNLGDESAEHLKSNRIYMENNNSDKLPRDDQLMTTTKVDT